jgi:CheY-like chemotaxis protein
VYLQFAVEDTGRGLSEQELKVLFQRFGQANPKTYGRYGGSGLGLFISRELTELQGGQIGVYSEVDEGTTFFIYIKAKRCHSSLPSPKNSRRSSMSDLLHDYKRQKGVMETVSTQFTPSKETANPFQIAGTSSTPTPATISPSIHDTFRPDQLHILLVEDNTINQRLLAQQLTREGCVVHTANHGGEALGFLSQSARSTARSTKLSVSNPETFPSSSMSRSISSPESRLQISIVLMDIEMPFMDGIECTTRIRSLEKDGDLVAYLPIIAVTANVRQEHKTKAFNAGMDAVVTKPFRIQDLMAKLKECMASVSIRESER